MKVKGLWFGGSSYSYPATAEHFASIAEAKEAFAHRFSHTDPYYPCVDDTSTMDIYPTDSDIDYPMMRFSVGPRGGVRVERG